ncbi:MAG TPA: hypothetical protein VFU06_00215 [Longimicrobiales bacterium]|nr:hypothetical protein [Longimicrobiales bacterium]
MSTDVSPTRRDASSEHVSFAGLAAVLLRYLPTAVWVGAGCALLLLVVAILGGKTYVARSTLKPAAGSQANSSMMAMASQLGLPFGMSADVGSLALYEEVLRSRRVLIEALQTEYTFKDGDRTIQRTLAEVYAGRPVTADNANDLIKRLRDEVRIHLNDAAGTITIETVAELPLLAEVVNVRLLELLNEFNLNYRQSRARAEREFLETRTRAQAERLAAAEEALQRFLTSNRNFGESSELGFEYQRLQRAVAFHQQIYLSLSQSLEQARLDEVRNTDVIVVVDNPEGSAMESGGGVLRAVIAGFAGTIVVLLAGLLVENFRRERVYAPSEYRTMVEMRKTLGMRMLPAAFRAGTKKHSS